MNGDHAADERRGVRRRFSARRLVLVTQDRVRHLNQDHGGDRHPVRVQHGIRVCETEFELDDRNTVSDNTITSPPSRVCSTAARVRRVASRLRSMRRHPALAGGRHGIDRHGVCAGCDLRCAFRHGTKRFGESESVYVASSRSGASRRRTGSTASCRQVRITRSYSSISERSRSNRRGVSPAVIVV